MDKHQVETIRKVIKHLKLDHVAFILGKTDKGELAYKIPGDADQEPYLTLDAVPLDKENNSEVLKILNT